MDICWVGLMVDSLVDLSVAAMEKALAVLLVARKAEMTVSPRAGK